MKTLIRDIQVFGTASMIVTLTLFSMGTAGCEKKEPPLSKEVLSLKQEVKERIEKYAPAFIDPLSRKNKAAVQEAMARLSLELTRGGQPLTWGAAVLDTEGVALGSCTSGGPQAGLNYSNIKPVTEALKYQKMTQGKFYRQDGFCAYYVLKPLTHQGRFVGLFVLGLSAKELIENKGVSEKEFLAIDFNQ